MNLLENDLAEKSVFKTENKKKLVISLSVQEYI